MTRTLLALMIAGFVVTGTASAAIDKHHLPLGDDMYSSIPKKGWVYSCQSSFNGGGAQGEGPWISDDGKTWDLTEKIAVRGSVSWDSVFNTTISGSTRRLSGNGLPPHTTGEFP